MPEPVSCARAVLLDRQHHDSVWFFCSSIRIHSLQILVAQQDFGDPDLRIRVGSELDFSVCITYSLPRIGSIITGI
jgi:hypothetical protein